MKFDVIIGNPPYNNDLYLDFVKTGYKALKPDGVMVMITPAKWQAKGGKKNEDFRQNIVPHMKEIVYWPNCADVFDVCERGGICYYYIDKDIYSDKKLSVRDNKHELLCGDSWLTSKFACLHNENVNNIINKLSTGKVYNPCLRGTKKLKVFTNLMICSAQPHSLYPEEGVLLLLNPMYVTEKNEYKSSNFKQIFDADTQSECESFISYVYTKAIRFLIYCGLCGNSIPNAETWRFVPDPGAFDHIFTDAELYQKYGLTQDEINIIESVIKEHR